MAGFTLKPASVQAPPPEESPSWLGKGASSVYALASLASLPSRATYGTINALTGGEGGFGNLAPFDASGGIEASHVLGRMGLVPKNDPEHWEPSDFARGVIDAVGDPTTWVGVGGLTKGGQALAKTGSLAEKLIPRIHQGQQALINIRSPLGHSIADVGTGPAVARAIETAGKKVTGNPVVKLVAKTAPVQALGKAAATVGRSAQGLFYAPAGGVTHADAIAAMKRRHAAIQKDTHTIWGRHIRMVRELAPLDEAAQKLGQMTPSQQIRQAIEQDLDMTGHPLEKYVIELRKAFADDLQKLSGHGTRHPGQLHDVISVDANGVPTKEIKYFPRGTELDKTQANLASAGNKSSKQRMRMFKGFLNGTEGPNGVNDIIMKTAQFAHSPAVQAISHPMRRRKAVENYLAKAHGAHIIAEYTRGGTKKNRLNEIAKYVLEHPNLQTERLYANAPMADSLKSQLNAAHMHRNAVAVEEALAKHLRNGPQSTETQTLRSAFKQLGYKPEMVEHIGALNGIKELAPNPFNAATHPVDYANYKMASDIARDNLMKSQVESRLVKQLERVGPLTSKSPAEDELFNAIQQGLNWFKGGVLMFPSSRVRDIGSGLAQNVLQNMASKKAYGETARLMSGQSLKHDYMHVPEVQEWFAKTGLPNTPENQTEAIRQLMAVHVPREHGVLGDLPMGQRGFKNEDLLANVPGRHQVSIADQFMGDPLRILLGKKTRNPTLENTDYTWNPLNFRGVGNRTSSGFRPAAASDVVSEAGDKLNRGAGFIHGLLNGYNAPEAARRVNAAQINYDPATFTPFEKRHLKKWLPFYSFGSRILPVTAKQLIDPGSLTSQLLKGQSRAYGGNPAIPDYVLDSSAIPIGTGPDGTMHFLTGAGLMHEPAVKMIGTGIKGLQTGDFRHAGTALASMVNPFVTAPIEQMLGASFSREGEPIANLESSSGRLAANLAALAGVRAPDAEPVKYPFRGYVDTLSSMTPVGRLLSTLRTATDTRRGIGHILTQKEPIQALPAAGEAAMGALPVVSGVRYYGVSKKKQVATLRKRAEEMAAETGARTRHEVFFPKDQLLKIAETDPEEAARMIMIQKYINGLRAQNKPAKGGGIKFVQ